jgi:hypothetical protein
MPHASFLDLELHEKHHNNRPHESLEEPPDMLHVRNQNMEMLIIWLWAVAALACQFRYLVLSGFPIVCFLKMKPSLLLSTTR